MNDGLGAEVGADLRHLLLHALIRADPRVLVRLHARVDVETREFFRQAGRELQSVGKLLRRRGERAFEGANRRQLGDKLVLRRAPRLVARINLRQVPLVSIGNRAAFLLLRGMDEHSGRQPRKRDGQLAREDIDVNSRASNAPFRTAPSLSRSERSLQS